VGSWKWRVGVGRAVSQAGRYLVDRYVVYKYTMMCQSNKTKQNCIIYIIKFRCV